MKRSNLLTLLLVIAFTLNIKSQPPKASLNETTGKNQYCTNTVNFFNPGGTSGPAYLYIVLAKPNTTFDFCAAREFKKEIKPGESYIFNFSSEFVCNWTSYSSTQCLGNYHLASGALNSQCCGQACSLSVRNQ